MAIKVSVFGGIKSKMACGTSLSASIISADFISCNAPIVSIDTEPGPLPTKEIFPSFLGPSSFFTSDNCSCFVPFSIFSSVGGTTPSVTVSCFVFLFGEDEVSKSSNLMSLSLFIG